MSSDLQRIQSDIARAKQRIAEMESGQRGVISEGARHQDGGRARENQLHAQRQSLARFEEELVAAMIAEHRWQPATIIERMAQPVQPAEQPQPLTIGDATRARLQCLLEDMPGAPFIPRSKLTEVLSR